MSDASDTETVLEVHDLQVAFGHGLGKQVVRGVSFDVQRGEIVGIIGESGSGKTLTALSILGLLPYGACCVGGQILFRGDDLLKMQRRQLERLRGDRIAMIFQDPSTAMNPVLRVGRQVAEPLVTHRSASWSGARAQAVAMLKRVHIPAAAERASLYPFQWSGGMLQRATIAMAVACEPELIIADEPTTALDVTIQAQILKLLRDIRVEQGTAILLITHDLGVVAEICDRVVVMYAGRVLETGTVHDVFRDPAHPYTRGLFAATPRVESKLDLDALPPLPPRQSESTAGCSFSGRCTHRHAACEEEPALIPLADRGSVRCWLYGNGQ